ncbi:LuxR C-terminal-related transcriptional regulator [Nocardia callitridis]|uniref:LuxR family transcriptional regulator n=1 Tax=Nocardia callitridis TaxID=648753 RepID=A0ABP9KPL0_9NOCA
MDSAQRGRHEPLRRALDPGASLPTVCFAPVERPEIFDRLDRVSRSGTERVLLMCAPAGSGKTVTLADWLERRVCGVTSFAWLTVTERLNEPTAFWRALCRALGIDADPILPRDRVAAPSAGATELVLALAKSPPSVLVIDDAHLVTDPLTASGLEHFLLHAPPQVTIVVAARHAPPLSWHRLDTRAELTRLGADDLALSRTQAALLCAQHGRAPSTDELDAVMLLTRGWAALVRLCGICLQANDRTAALAAFARPAHAVSDFLVGEVLAALPNSTRTFLIRTSIPEEFTEELASELTGQPAQALLDGLERMWFPISSVVRTGQRWFHYHPMLRAHLLGEAHRTEGDRLPELHLRAAHWHRDVGSPLVALGHLLAGPDHEHLHDFLRERGLGLAMTDDGGAALALLDRAVPELSGDPFLWLLRAVHATTTGSVSDAVVYLEMLGVQANRSESSVAQEWLAPLLAAVTIDVAATTGVASARQWQPTTEPTGNLDLDAYLTVQSATAMILAGDLAAGERQLRRGLAFAEHAGHPYLAVRSATRLASLAGLRGAIGSMRDRADRAVELAAEQSLSSGPDTAQAIAIGAFGAYLQGEHWDSAELTSVLLDHADQDGSTSPVAGWHGCVIGRLLAVEDAEDKYAATEALRRSLLTLLLAQPDATPARSPVVVAVSGLVAPVTSAVTKAHGPGTARQLVDRARVVLGDIPEIKVAQATLADATNKPRTTRTLLAPMLDDPAALHPVTAVSAWLLYASALDRLDTPWKTGISLENALRTAEPEHLIRPFLQLPAAIGLLDTHVGRFGHADRFADEIRHHPSVRRHPDHAVLTGAEMAVLKRLPAGHTAQQIAEELGVSVNTVKTHLRGIYAKLDANSRVDALDRARHDGMV